MDRLNGRDITIECKNLVVHGQEWGKRGGAPMLALHGWLDNAASFEMLGPLINKYHIIAIDLPGHGHSGHYPPGFHYHFVDYVQTVINVVDELDWTNFYLMGHSLGGAIATLVAASFPDRVTELFLIDALGPLTEDVANAPQRLAKSVYAMLHSEKRQNLYPNLETAMQVRQKSGDLNDDMARALVRRGMAKVADGYIWRFDTKLLMPSHVYFTESQAQTFLSDIKCPTLLIEAKKGLVVKVNTKLVKKRKACIKKLEVLRVDGGHHVHMEHPAAIAEILNT